MTRPVGIVAAGHEITADAARVILEDGGNAFDAALGGLFAACVAEPVLASLGGGGFLLARRAKGDSLLYDFFSQTPRRKIPLAEVDFYPILADFGKAQQEFHIGLGSIATPGVVRGIFQMHRDLCRLPLNVIAAPALDSARRGVRLNSFQHYISSRVAPILRATPEALRLHATDEAPDRFARQNELVRQPDMADSFEVLIGEGEDLFYRGEMTRPLLDDCHAGGGYLHREDLAGYRVVRRTPLELDYRGSRLLTNPAPALGGALIAFSLSLLQAVRLADCEFGGEAHLRYLARAMGLTQQLRRDENLDSNLDEETVARMLGKGFIPRFRELLRRHSQCARGTTQISVADNRGNLASMTLSNGEGSGYVLPGTGIMLNNILGEEDINAQGFHRWPSNRRISSMMAPSLVFIPDGRIVATGSGGSNRIRSAILQVISNLVDFRMSVQDAVIKPRIHFESELLNLEPPREKPILRALAREFPHQKLWDDQNLFFGGAHTVQRGADGRLSGAGDPRRGGLCR